MHLLLVTTSFPTPQSPISSVFIKDQVHFLSEHVERISIFSPRPVIPFLSKFQFVFPSSNQPPVEHTLHSDAYRAYFPRYLKFPGRMLHSWTAYQWCRLLKNRIRDFEQKGTPVTLLHAHHGVISGYAAVRVASEFKLPVLVTYHGSDINLTLTGKRKGSKYCLYSLQNADQNIFVSTTMIRLVQKYLPLKNYLIQPMSIDCERFVPAQTLCIEKRVLFVGRMEDKKGVFDLLHSWKKILTYHPDAQLVLVGKDCSDGQFQKTIRELELEQNVDFRGLQPPDSIALMLKQSRVFCLPSYSEGVPVCIMEAMASGLPVVATDVGGIPDIVLPKQNGILIPAGSIDSLVKALKELLDDYDLCQRMGQQARSYALQNLDGRKNALDLHKMYLKLNEEKS